MRVPVAATTVLLLCTGVPGQDYLQVPEVTTAQPQVFKALFTQARFAGLHAVMIGDSQEACPLSHGLKYMPAFNARWADCYGVSPRTPLVQPGQNFGVNAPAAEWLVAGRMLWPFATDVSPFTSPGALPGLADWPLPAPQAGQRGWAVVLQPFGTGVQAEPIDRSRRWLDDRSGVYIEVYAHKSGGPARVFAGAVQSLYPEGNATMTHVFVVDPATDVSTTSPVGRVRVGPVVTPPGGEGLLQIEVRGEDPSRPARLVSLSMVSVASDVGLTVSDIAAGGYTSASLLNNHAQALDHLGGLGLGAAFVSLGANDASGFTAEQLKANLGQIIDALRVHCGPTLPVVLLSDPPSALWSAAARQRAEFYPRVAAEIALERAAVCAVNTRRLVHQQGWTLASAYTFSFDGVHYRQEGAGLKAREEVRALWNAFVCPADIGTQGGIAGSDGELDNNDFVVFVEGFFAAAPFADLGGQGGERGADGGFDNNDFVAFVDAFFAGC